MWPNCFSSFILQTVRELSHKGCKGNLLQHWINSHLNIFNNSIHEYLQCSLNTGYITPWSRVLLEKLIFTHLVKKFPAFCGTQMFFTMFTAEHSLNASVSNNYRHFFSKQRGHHCHTWAACQKYSSPATSEENRGANSSAVTLKVPLF
jgi:hypothetical protein